MAAELGAIPLLFDLSDLKSISKKVQEAMSFLDGKIDTLVNNAGIGVFPELGEITEDDLVNVYTTTVRSTYCIGLIVGLSYFSMVYRFVNTLIR